MLRAEPASLWLLAGMFALTPAGAMAQQKPAPVSSAPKAAVSAAENSGPAPAPAKKRDAEKFYLQGLRAINKGDAEAAEKAFARAAQADPANREYRADYEIARAHGITDLIQSADKARILGHFDVARAKLAQALALDPKNPEVDQHIDDLANLAITAPPPDDATATIAPPIELAPLPGRRSFHLKGPEQEILRQVLSAYGITAIFDASVSRQLIHFDADDADFAQAEDLLSLATDSFLTPLDPKRVLAARDTKDNRAQYQRVAFETLHLPGLTAAEMSDMGNIARNVIGIQQATVQANSETITARAPMPTLLALNQTFADLLEGRSEVLVDVRLFSIDKSKTQNIGLQLPQSYTLFNLPSELNSVLQQNQSLVQQIISSGLASAGDTAAIAALLIASGQVSSSILNQPFALFGGGLTESGVSLSGITANLSLNSSDTRALDQIQLRLENGEKGTIRSGTRYPIETSNYTSIGASSVSIPGLNSAGLSSTLSGLGVNLNNLSTAQPVPQVQYQDLGLTLEVTPKIERTDQVALKLDFKLTALQGTTLNGLPVLTNTSYSADVAVGSGSSAMLVSDMTRQQSNAVSGIPGLSELPGFQSTTNNQTQFDVSNLVILVTPHLLRRRNSERIGPYIPLPRHGF